MYDHDEPLQIFLTGPAGAGKTTLLLALMESCNRFTQLLDTGRNAYVACATTGKAAVNLSGNTIHVTFNISIDPSRRTLTGQMLQAMRCDFSEILLVIIDEISMAGSHLLHSIEERLRSIGPDRTKRFGGMHVILCGDLRQLPPVRAKVIYSRPANMLQDRMIWQNLSYYPLTEIMRQSDQTFSSLLTKIGDGTEITNSERAVLEDRFIDAEEADGIKDAVRIFFRNDEVNNYIYNVLMTEPSRVLVDANDVVVGDVSSMRAADLLRKLGQMALTDTGQMSKTLILVVGRLYMLSQNMDNSYGLVNGAVGTLRHIENDPDRPDEPFRLWIEFQRSTTGAAARLKYRETARRLRFDDTVTPILKRSATLKVLQTAHVRRTQFPVITAGALTIHKFQGGSYDKVIYNYDRTHEIALVYVALSQAHWLVCG